jgi:hypothetical protein
VDEIKFNKILQECDLSAKGISLINNLLSKNHIELLTSITNFSAEDINNISKIKPCMEKAANEISDAFYSYMQGVKIPQKLSYILK